MKYFLTRVWRLFSAFVVENTTNANQRKKKISVSNSKWILKLNLKNNEKIRIKIFFSIL